MSTVDAVRRPWLVRRWPSLAGIALAASLAAGLWLGIAEPVELARVLVAAGLVYLGSAALRERRAAWPLFGLTFVLIGIGFVVPAFAPTAWMLGAAVLLTAWGFGRGAARPAWGLPLQSAAMIVIAALAVTAAWLGGPWAAGLIAAGLLGHAAWDVHHHRTGRVVARSMAEFCAVLDSLLAVVVLVAGFGGIPA